MIEIVSFQVKGRSDVEGSAVDPGLVQLEVVRTSGRAATLQHPGQRHEGRDEEERTLECEAGGIETTTTLIVDRT